MNQKFTKLFSPSRFIHTRNLIRPYIIHTPLLLADKLSSQFGHEIYLKMESVQHTGSFKLRGASSAMLNLSEAERTNGVCTYSTGNHGRAVSYIGRKLNVPVHVFLSKLVPENKKRNIERLGGKIQIGGASQDEAQAEAERVAKEQGLKIIPPFDSKEIILGQGTMGLEIMEDLPHAGTVMIPLSGGGLLSGVAACLKQLRPELKIIGVSMDKGAAMIESINAGQPTEVEEFASLADSLGGGIGLDNEYTFEITKNFADELATVTEEEIADAMKTLYHEQQIVCEGASAVCLAALKSGRCKVDSSPIVIIISGCNFDTQKYLSIVN